MCIRDRPPTWRSKPLVLVLDHINGVNDDYRADNLRLLCPNCNSQTSTFCGRNRGSLNRKRLQELEDAVLSEKTARDAPALCGRGD